MTLFKFHSGQLTKVVYLSILLVVFIDMTLCFYRLSMIVFVLRKKRQVMIEKSSHLCFLRYKEGRHLRNNLSIRFIPKNTFYEYSINDQ